MGAISESLLILGAISESLLSFCAISESLLRFCAISESLLSFCAISESLLSFCKSLFSELRENSGEAQQQACCTKNLFGQRTKWRSFAFEGGLSQLSQVHCTTLLSQRES